MFFNYLKGAGGQGAAAPVYNAEPDYSVGGKSPEVVVDFINNYYRKDDVGYNTYSDVLDYIPSTDAVDTGITAMRPTVNSLGQWVWPPHNLIFYFGMFL